MWPERYRAMHLYWGRFEKVICKVFDGKVLKMMHTIIYYRSVICIVCWYIHEISYKYNIMLTSYTFMTNDCLLETLLRLNGRSSNPWPKFHPEKVTSRDLLAIFFNASKRSGPSDTWVLNGGASNLPNPQKVYVWRMFHRSWRAMIISSTLGNPLRKPYSWTNGAKVGPSTFGRFFLGGKTPPICRGQTHMVIDWELYLVRHL